MNAPEILKNKKIKHGQNVIASYADLPRVISVVEPVLNKYEITHRWESEQTDTHMSVTCILTHKLGHSERNRMTAPADTSGSKNAIQALGSTKTYLERYTFLGVTGLAVTDLDDDGNAAGLGPTITEEQEATISAKIKEVGADEGGFLKYLKVESLCDLPADHFAGAMKALAAKANQKEPG